jgi:wobble nucleotide-excising tRNase
MNIRKIDRLNYARFKNFNWDSSLGLFSDQINILFGWNGSGKTTLSDFLRSIEKNDLDKDSKFKLTTDTETITEISTLNNFESDIRVFNDSYIQATLRGSSNIPYIFFAGKDAVDYSEDETELNDKKIELSKIILPDAHSETAKNTALLIKGVTGINSYRKELTGGGTYSSYDKIDFEKRINDIKTKIKDEDIASHEELTRKDIDTLKTQLVNSDRLAKTDKEISVAAQWLLDKIDAINTTLQESPVQEISNRISLLKDNQSTWVEEGVALHFGQETPHTKCFFCDSEIENMDELLKHFSEEVINTVNHVDTYLEQIESKTINLSKVESPTLIQKERVILLRSLFDEITPKLREKRNAVSDKKEVIVIDEVSVTALIKVDETDFTETAYAIESHYVSEQYTKYIQECKTYEAAIESRKNIDGEIQKLDTQVRTLKQKAKNTHESSSALNAIFKVAFPYKKIKITDSDDGTGYVLKRDGKHCSFSSLSEGEKNLMALSYFIFSLNDAQSKLSDDGVVLIDDPVSSLDKQAIFQIFSIIVNEIKKHTGRQYFILTHNLDFFGHLKECFRKKIENKSISLFSISATNEGSVIENIPSLLQSHRSDYYYVFSVLYSFKDSCSLEDSYLILNLLRRWLETFLEFKFTTSGDFQSTLESSYGEARKITEKLTTPFSANHLEMYRFINHGSHGFTDTESIDDSILTNANQRIQEALELVKILDPLHYKKLESMTNRV